jgi:hypothetical protein
MLTYADVCCRHGKYVTALQSTFDKYKTEVCLCSIFFVSVKAEMSFFFFTAVTFWSVHHCNWRLATAFTKDL